MQSSRKTLLAFSALATLMAMPAMPALADEAHHKPATASAAAAPDMTDGEIRKIDLDASKITLKHGEIKNLDMPAMTMVFVVKDKAVLGQFKAGDKVRFKAVNEGGKITVIDLVAAP